MLKCDIGTQAAQIVTYCAKINVRLFAKTMKLIESIVEKLTPIIAFSSDVVTCFALSTALATCCWCCKPCYHYRVVVTLDREIVRHTCQTESQRLTSCARNGSNWTIIAFNLLAISVCNYDKLARLMQERDEERDVGGSNRTIGSREISKGNFWKPPTIEDSEQSIVLES